MRSGSVGDVDAVGAVDLEVDETRRHDQARGVEPVGRASARRSNPSDPDRADPLTGELDIADAGLHARRR